MQTPELLSDPAYHDEDAARAYIESIRWPTGPVCPHCGSVEKIRPVGGPSMGPGWYYCGACKDKFTVRVGGIFERSHIPLHKWLLAIRLMASSKKGISANQLHRTLGITLKSAWFLGHRIREAMADNSPAPLGGEGVVIEADETFIGREGSHDPTSWVYTNDKGWVRSDGKMKVMTLVERGGKARSIHVDRLTSLGVYIVLHNHADPASELNTDEAPYYRRAGRAFKKHEAVNHAREEWARGSVTTNTVEGFFSIFKRGMKGVYQHCGEKHLQRYLAEFDFRYSNRKALGIEDTERAAITIKGAEGKRLTYRRTRRPAKANARTVA
jgi:transposase-like protein